MITEQHAAERLSRAYVQALAAKLGVNVHTRDLDYGVDGTFHPVQVVESRHLESGYPLDFQLKASKRWSCDNGEVTFDLEVKTHNDFVRRRSNPGSVPIVLLLLCLPDSPEEWCSFTEEELLLRKCCYWFRPRGDLSDNTSTVRVRIPRTNLATPEAVQILLDSAKTGRLP